MNHMITVNKLVHYNNVHTYCQRQAIPCPTKDNILSGLPTCVGTPQYETFPNIDTSRI